MNEVKWLEEGESVHERKSFERTGCTDAGTLFCGQHLQTQLFRTDQGLYLVGDDMSNRARGVRKFLSSQGILAMNNEEPNSCECASELFAIEDSVFGCKNGRLNRGDGRREKRHAPITAAGSPKGL